MNFDINQLNEEQRLPVLDTEGAVLVTAGAGSGKTRLLTHRIAHIITDLGVRPYSVLAITFTNKAANEMRSRLNGILGEQTTAYIWVHTFHALCLRILRKFIGRIEGFDINFSIYDEKERERVVKRVVKAMKIKEEMMDDVKKSTESLIAYAKTYALSPEDCADDAVCQERFEYLDEAVEGYKAYQEELKKNNALDFDDILLKAFYLLKNDQGVREYYQDKFRYIHVDEFQDTNTVQYDIVRILAAKHGNILVVGDEDQSIYGWRGANFRNIFNFQKDFICKVYKLEQNYRSTKKILALANKIIKINSERLEKTLWTDNADGEEVTFYDAPSDDDEANYVLRTIHGLVRSDKCRYSDIAILMRINALTRSFEERFVQHAIPYKIFGGFKFYDRKEIKDLLAYLKIAGNHNDTEAIARVINFPKRGIGEGALTQLFNYSAITNNSLYNVIYNIEQNPDFTNGFIKKILPFTNIIKCMQSAVESGGKLSDLACYIIKISGMKEEYAEDNLENKERKENIRELVHSIERFEKDYPGATLADYLQQIALYTDLDEMNEENDCINIATIHSAKGLEFNTVFVVGMEEGVFPDSRRDETADGMEEERRLMYVAVTRAKKKLYLTMARSRFKFGRRQYSEPSSFLKEGGLIKEETRRSAYQEYSGRYDSYRGERAYSSTGDNYNREEVPLYSPAPPKPVQKTVTGCKDLSKFQVGKRVRHAKFGEGVVMKIEQKNDVFIEVKFSMGTLTLLLQYAPLEPLD